MLSFSFCFKLGHKNLKVKIFMSALKTGSFGGKLEAGVNRTAASATAVKPNGVEGRKEGDRAVSGIRRGERGGVPDLNI